MASTREHQGSVSRILLPALGFACLAACNLIPFACGGSFTRKLVGPESAIYLVQSLACLCTLVVLAVLALRRTWRIGKTMLIASGALQAASLLVLGFATNEAAQLAAGAFSGVASGILMYSWAMFLASLAPKSTAQVTLLGFLVSSAVLVPAVYLPPAIAFSLAAAAAAACALLLVLCDSTLSFAIADGPLEREEMHKMPWFTVVVIVACGQLAMFLYGLAMQVTWLYGQATNYVAFAISALAVLLLTVAIMQGEGEWPAAAWVPLFVVFVVGVVFACLSTSQALEVSIGLLLGCIAGFHFLRFAVFPALVSHLELPRAFLMALLLAVTNGYVAAWLGAWLARAITLGMKGIAQMAGLVAVVVLVLFALMVALFMSKPRRAAEMTSSSSNQPDPQDVAGDYFAARLAQLADEFALTDRELEVTELSAQGFNAPYIAEKLVVSQSTVRFHLQNVYRKMGIHSRAELIEMVNPPADAEN